MEIGVWFYLVLLKKLRMRSKRFCHSLNAASPAKVKSMSGGPNLDGSNMIEDINPYLGEDYSAMVRKFMVVVDSTREAKRALLWVLSHALLKHDQLILLHVAQVPPDSAKNGRPRVFIQEVSIQFFNTYL